MSTNKTLFLDRDGVINIDHGYLYRSEDFEFIPGVFEACRKFQQSGYRIVVVTNQSGIGRGYYTENDFHVLTQWMLKQFAENQIEVLDVFFCPHHPTKALPQYLKDCDCRKPAPGMLLQAIEKHGLDPNNAIMVGDKVGDMKAAENAGVDQKFLVTSGQSLSAQDKQAADGVYPSLLALAESILA